VSTGSDSRKVESAKIKDEKAWAAQRQKVKVKKVVVDK